MIFQYRNALRLLATTMESAGGGGANDVERVMTLSAAIAERLEMSEREIDLVCEVARFRDLGKAEVPISILTKPGSLARDEWEQVKAYPSAGERLLAALPGSEELARAVRHIHERWDGRGYPDGLAGESIPPASRIVNCAGAFDVIRRDRPHRAGREFAVAKAEVQRGCGTLFDPGVVRALFEVLTQRGEELDPRRPEHFLIVEDSRPQRELCRRILAAHYPGYGIDQAETALAGIEFLAAMTACAGLICDFDLDQEGDFERVVGEARRRHDRVPIVAISARMSAERRERCLAAGADATLAKGPGLLRELPQQLRELSLLQPA